MVFGIEKQHRYGIGIGIPTPKIIGIPIKSIFGTGVPNHLYIRTRLSYFGFDAKINDYQCFDEYMSNRYLSANFAVIRKYNIIMKHMPKK